MTFRFNLKQLAVETWTKLRDLRDAPHAIAGGVAIGMFWGFTPLVGLKSLLSIFTAWVLRCSKFPAVIAVAFHDVLLPVWPVILRWEYQIGYWMLSNPHHLPPRLSAKKLHFSEFFHLKTLEVLWPTLLGSLVIGIPSALICYWIVERALERYEQTKNRQLTPPP
jgi:uncharacterized protein (DUF2062 family)